MADVKRENSGRRVHDKFWVKSLYVGSGFFGGHWITKKFPGMITGASSGVAELGTGIIDFFGGATVFLNVCVFAFSVYRYFKDRAK